VRPEKIAEARALQPVHERDSLGRTVMLVAGAGRERLTPLGEVRTPAIADLFLAVVGGAQPAAPREGAAR
jgi:ABC-2 type transport system ATP-binding protein